MKKIYFMRHGKAEDGDGKSDFERELVDKGRKKTAKVAQFLKSKSVKPERLLVSMSQRTAETAALVCRHLEIDSSLVTEEKSLYLASTNSILDVIYCVNDNIDEIMIFGHNPGLSSIATYLCKDEIDWMPTSAVVGIAINIDRWNEINSKPGRLLFYTKPSDL